MASQWWGKDNVSSTLPPKPSPELQDLFVFGYACKLFRDDEKAGTIDGGKHLIPWMGDNRLLIDRYDGRGHLFDLSAHDAENIKTEDIELSETELAVEKACDEERYLELRTDVAEAELYEEEEWKRYYESLHDGYKAVGFSYEQGQDEDSQDKADLRDVISEEDQPFVPGPELNLPKGINMPETNKSYSIMEKTAKFIAEHGAQMEIIIKAKQSSNGQFDFMHFEDRLYQFYKHLIKIIKSGKFKPKLPEVKSENKDESGDDDDDGSYLHPLLNARLSTQPSKPVPIPVVAIHKTSYGQLIRSIKDNTARSAECGGSIYHSSTPPLGQPHAPHYDSSLVPPPPGTETVVLPLLTHPQRYKAEKNGEHRKMDDDDVTALPSEIVPPPPDIQPIIDRMAMYVAKNGVEFEIVVKSKKDLRFQFLHTYHMHFPYYDFKKQLFLKEIEQEEKDDVGGHANKAISFSIKTRPKEPETNVAPMKKPLFDYGSSDDNDDNPDRERSTNAACDNIETEEVVVLASQQDNGTNISNEVLEKKLAEERLRDRLAIAARDKLAQASKEKQVQAERKRKAAMFINLLKIKPDECTKDAATEAGSPNGTTRLPSRASTPGIPTCQERPHTNDGHRKNRHRSRSPRHRSRSRSPSNSWRWRRSPTPPSSFSIFNRSRSRSKSRRTSPSWTGMGRRRSRSPRKTGPVPRLPGSRRSPAKLRGSPSAQHSHSHDRKKKSRSHSPGKSKKRSKSKSPTAKHKKSKNSDSRSPKKKKKKDKDRDKDKDKRKDKNKEKDRHRTKVVRSKDGETDVIDADSIQPLEVISTDSVDNTASKIVDPEPVEIIEIDDNDDLPEILSFQPAENENKSSPSLSANNPLSGRNSPSGKPAAAVPQHLLSRVRALLKASRDVVEET